MQDKSNSTASIKDELAQLSADIDNALNEYTPEDMLSLSDQLKTLVSTTKTELATVNDTLRAADVQDHSAVLQSAQSSFNDLRDLITITKGITGQIYAQLTSLDLPDPDLVDAAASFMKATRESIADFIQLYRDEQAFLYRVQMAMLNFTHRKELLRYKAELDANKDVIDMPEDSVKYKQEDIVDLL